MPSTKISQLGAATSVETNDLFVLVDVSDSSMAPTGTNKKISRENSDASGVGYMGIPQNLQNADYSTLLSDRSKRITHTSGSAHSYTISDDDGYTIGTVLAFANAGAGIVTIDVETGTLTLWPDGSTGPVELAQYGEAYAEKIGEDSWKITVGVAASEFTVEGTANQVTVVEASGVFTISLPAALALPGTVTAENGAAGSPAFGFTDDADTGMFLVGDGTIGITVAGTERVRIIAGSTWFKQDDVLLGTTADIGFSRIGANTLGVMLNSVEAVRFLTSYTWFKTDEIVLSSSADVSLLRSATGLALNVDLTFSDIGDGPVVKSPNGNKWRLSVDNAGAVSAVAV